MTRAFVADPMMRWVFPDDDAYEDEIGIFFGVMFDIRIDAGTIWCTDDGVAAACWEGPEGNPRGKEWTEAQWAAAFALLPERARHRMMLIDRAVSSEMVPEPHWYLALLGTHPDWQRQGLGRTLLAPVLDRADADGLRASLVTESPENVAFYRGVGFEVVAEPDLDDGGPPLWVMHREPGAARR